MKLTGIFLRLYDLHITNKKLKIDFYKEHKLILKKKSIVAIGKAGQGFPTKKINELNRLIAIQEGKMPLFLYNKKDNKLFLASIIKIGKDSPNYNYLYPEYYNNLTDIGIWFYVSKLKKIDLEVLEKILLYTNGKKIVDVIKNCRTSCMLVNIEMKKL